MKTSAALFLLVSVGIAMAQPSVPSSVTSGTIVTTGPTTAIPTDKPNEVSGQIVSYNSSTATLVVQIPDVAAPASYTTNNTTTIVDYADHPLGIAQLQAGQPVTVFFDPSTPGKANKIILRKYAKPPQ